MKVKELMNLLKQESDELDIVVYDANWQVVDITGIENKRVKGNRDAIVIGLSRTAETINL